MSDRRAAIAIIVLLSILVISLLGGIALILVRRRKAGRKLRFRCPPVAGWFRKDDSHNTADSESKFKKGSWRAYHAPTASYGSIDTELGDDPLPSHSHRAAPIAEVAQNPARGTSLNPAELEGDAPRSRWSWMLRVPGMLAWTSRSPSPSRTTPSPSQARSRPSSRMTATTSYTADRKSFGEDKLSGLQVPIPVRPGTARIISIHRSMLPENEPPPLPEANTLGWQVSQMGTWNRLSGASAGTFGARIMNTCDGSHSVNGRSSRDGSDSGSDGPRPKPPDKG